MRLKLWTAMAVFLGLYLGLSVILLVQDFDVTSNLSKGVGIFKHPIWSIPPVILTLICFVVTVILLTKLPAKRSFKITDVKYIPSEMINYTFPYIVSFMSVSYDEITKVLGFMIFLILLFTITYRAGRIFVNPLLIVIGLRAYEVTYIFAGDTVEWKTLALAHTTDLSVGFVDGAQIEDILLIRMRAGV